MARRARSPWIVVAILAVAGLFGLAMLPPLFRSLVYPAPPVAVPPAPPPLVEVTLRLPDGDAVCAWAGAGGAAAPARPGDAAPLVLFFHGNGENLETMRQAGLFAAIAELGVGGRGARFLALDYPGYGRSEGGPSEARMLAAADAAVAWAEAELARAPAPLVVCGWSLGAAVAVQMAARHPARVGGLIALSPWTSLAAVAAQHYPGALVRLVPLERYDSLAAVPEIRCPALVVHGESDWIIPAAQGRALAAALGARAVVVRERGHNDLLADDEVWREIDAFLERLATVPTAPVG